MAYSGGGGTSEGGGGGRFPTEDCYCKEKLHMELVIEETSYDPEATVSKDCPYIGVDSSGSPIGAGKHRGCWSVCLKLYYGAGCWDKPCQEKENKGVYNVEYTDPKGGFGKTGSWVTKHVASLNLCEDYGLCENSIGICDHTWGAMLGYKAKWDRLDRPDKETSLGGFFVPQKPGWSYEDVPLDQKCITHRTNPTDGNIDPDGEYPMPNWAVSMIQKIQKVADGGSDKVKKRLETSMLKLANRWGVDFKWPDTETLLWFCGKSDDSQHQGYKEGSVGNFKNMATGPGVNRSGDTEWDWDEEEL